MLMKRCMLGVCLALQISCGGGSGGGTADGRTTSTAIRIVHGGIETTPISLRVGLDTVQSGRFAEATQYVKLEKGEAVIGVERQNSPGVIIGTHMLTLEDNTEYTLFLYGEEEKGNVNTVLIKEPVSRPDVGFARLQILNSRSGSDKVSVAEGDIVYGPAAFGSSSGFFDLPSGLHTFKIKDESHTIKTISVDIPDRGELTVHVTGSGNIGIDFVSLLFDLD